MREYCLSLLVLDFLKFLYTQKGQKHYYMLRYHNPIFYNDKEKTPTHFLDTWELRKQTVYGFETWKSRLSDETHETMLGGV